MCCGCERDPPFFAGLYSLCTLCCCVVGDQHHYAVMYWEWEWEENVVCVVVHVQQKTEPPPREREREHGYIYIYTHIHIHPTENSSTVEWCLVLRVVGHSSNIEQYGGSNISYHIALYTTHTFCCRIMISSESQDTPQVGSLAGAARLLHHNAGVPKHRSGGTETYRGGEGHKRC